MREEIRQDLISILKDSTKAIRQNNAELLKEVSDHTIHDASIFQDRYSASIAVIIYSLSKVLEKNKYKEYKNWNEFYMKFTKGLERARESLERNQLARYNSEIRNIYRLLTRIERQVGIFITEVLKQAQIKKGSRIYEHGISLGRVGELLGVSTWDLMPYVGQTKITDARPAKTKPVKERLEFTKKLFS